MCIAEGGDGYARMDRTDLELAWHTKSRGRCVCRMLPPHKGGKMSVLSREKPSCPSSILFFDHGNTPHSTSKLYSLLQDELRLWEVRFFSMHGVFSEKLGGDQVTQRHLRFMANTRPSKHLWLTCSLRKLIDLFRI